MREQIRDKPGAASGHRENDAPREYDAEAVRQGEIILRQRWQQIVFIAGLAGAIGLVALAGIMVALHSAGSG